MIFSGPWYSSHFLFHKSNFLPKTTSLEKTLLFSTGIYISLAWLYLHCTWLYNTLCWLYFTSHNSRSTFLPYYFTLYLNLPYVYHGSISLYSTLLPSTIALLYIILLHSTWLYITVQYIYFTLLDTTILYLYLTQPWFYYIPYLSLHYSTNVSTSLLYLTLLPSIMALLLCIHSTLATIAWVCFTLLDS